MRAFSRFLVLSLGLAAASAMAQVKVGIVAPFSGPFIFNAATSDITTKSDYDIRTSYTLWQVTVPMAQHAARMGVKKVVAGLTPGSA
jgi:branched-chain amino acid transport system substrate-binding protein